MNIWLSHKPLSRIPENIKYSGEQSILEFNRKINSIVGMPIRASTISYAQSIVDYHIAEMQSLGYRLTKDYFGDTFGYKVYESCGTLSCTPMVFEY